MARISLSPLIVDVRNKQADTVFAKWKGVNYIRSRVTPSNPNTTNQQEVRAALRNLVKLWQTQNIFINKNRDYYARGKDKSGFNDYVGQNAVAMRASNILQLCRASDENPLTSFDAQPWAQPGRLYIAFAPSPVPAGKILCIHLFVPGSSTIAKTQEHAAGTTTPLEITGLTPGATYHCYGFLRKSAWVDGNDVSLDLSDTQAAGS